MDAVTLAPEPVHLTPEQAAVAKKAAENIKAAFYDDKGRPVIANGGRRS